jgi:hypothetical protein
MKGEREGNKVRGLPTPPDRVGSPKEPGPRTEGYRAKGEELAVCMKLYFFRLE